MKEIVCTKYGSPDVVNLEEVGNLPIVRRYPLSEVAEDIRYLEEGPARGKVVITLEHDDNA